MSRHTPEEHPEEHWTMPEDHIFPRPASRRLVLTLAAITGASLIGAATAVTLIAITTTDTSNGLHHIIDTNSDKGQLRDEQHTQTENQIRALADKVSKSEETTNKAICTLVIASVQQGIEQNRPVTLPVLAFAKSINCVIPASLLPH